MTHYFSMVCTHFWLDEIKADWFFEVQHTRNRLLKASLVLIPG